MPASAKNAKLNDESYIQLGKAVEQALITDYVALLRTSRAQAWGAFFRGILGGLGGVIGATVGVALLAALLQLFGGTPVIGHYFENLGTTISHRSK